MDTKKIINEYIDGSDWRIKENSNMAYSLQGLNNHVVSHAISDYWLKEIYPTKIGEAHLNGDYHIHDLSSLGSYCGGWDLKDILIHGFNGVSGKVESSPPKHLRSALGQLVNFMYTLQGEMAGAQAVSSFDTLLAPYVRYDGLDYTAVKQAIQEFVFNMNVPTRVGFQCLSEDTEILTSNGWATHNEVGVGEQILTYNLDNETIEKKNVKEFFRRDYSGEMYHLKNRDTDQLISPEHRVVRRKSNGGEVELIKIEDLLELKGPYNIPVKTNGYDSGDNINRYKMLLAAWIISEGTVDRHGRGVGRISIAQKKGTSGYERIQYILNKLDFYPYERTSTSEWGECTQIRLSAEDSKIMYEFFNSDKQTGLKFIPDVIKNSSKQNIIDFINEYIKGDGNKEDFTTSTIFPQLVDDFGEMAVKAGYLMNVCVKKPGRNSKRDLYSLNFRSVSNAYIQKEDVKKVNYSGIIWCPTTDNGTIIARRNGKIFLTGNSVFSNITMDIVPDKDTGNENVVVDGKIMKEKYKDFDKERDTINIAFADVMMEGDAKGRIFTFPIPTYNITKEFKWGSPVANKVFEMTGKYGIPYFSNFINSDMDPSDVRSMCCRLRIDNRTLKKRGGGLFGANPLTGSIGIVTINLPRIGYLSKTNDEFFGRISELMDLAKESLVIKRKVIEEKTARGMYPYSAHYLKLVHERFGEYWKNHFSTIGLIGMNEASLNLHGCTIATKEGKEFAEETLIFMRDKLIAYQEETGDVWNLEATPAEGTTRRLAAFDKKKYPDIIVANEDSFNKTGAAPYYTNSSHLPVDYTSDAFESLDHQDSLQALYTGGTVSHMYLGESIKDYRSVEKLVKTIAEKYTLPYFTITPTFSVCPVHGFLSGEHQYCPKCDAELKEQHNEEN